MISKLNYSLIIPTKDRPDELRKCLQYVLAQKIKPEKFIIVDDGKLDPEEIRSWLGSEGDHMNPCFFLQSGKAAKNVEHIIKNTI